MVFNWLMQPSRKGAWDRAP